MWNCPLCGRAFAKENQSHYCGDAPKTIDEYIAAQDESKRADLLFLRETIARAIPDAQERISWGMPTYWKEHNLVHFAAFKAHIGFYIGSQAVEHFQGELSAYPTNKGAVRLPYGNIDKDLVARISKWCRENEQET